MMLSMFLVGLILPVGNIAFQRTTYNSTRDYLIMSEKYPEAYPRPETWEWQWSTDSGQWAIYCVDFHLACMSHTQHTDRFIITDSDKDQPLTFTCGYKPPVQYFQSTFRVALHANPAPAESEGRGFKCHVLHGENKDEVESKVNAMKASTGDDQNASKDDSSNHTQLIVITVLIVVIVIIIVVAIVIVCVVLPRRHQQQTTNTSVHLNIGEIRRNSSVSYTRNGGGGDAGARPRLNSEDSISPDMGAGRPMRPVKRSGSNSSWAMRAEMSNSVRNGSCSNEGHRDNTTEYNLYSPLPTKTNDCCRLFNNGRKGFNGEPGKGQGGFGEAVVAIAETGPISVVGCRLSTISEESQSITKLKTSFPVPVQAKDASFATCNAGYMLMTNCSANYANYGV